MPTATGLLRRGDRIRHRETRVVCEVLERLGNDAVYSVRVRRLDGKSFPSTGTPERIMTEIAYWLTQGWELVP